MYSSAPELRKSLLFDTIMPEDQPTKRKLESPDIADAKKPKAEVKTSPELAAPSKPLETDTDRSLDLKSSEPNKPHAEQDNKPVFGSTSTFGKASAFEVSKNKPSIFDSKTDDRKSKPFGSSTASFGSSFGSSFGANSKFSGAFENSTKKKSFLDEPEEKVDQSGTESPSATPKAPQQYKQVDLKAQEVKTGEEDEKSVFSANAKLFELDLTNISEGWKERGLGPLHLNQSLKDPLQLRIVMRSQGLLRVILNYKITASTELIKGLEASLAPGKYMRINSVSLDGKPVQYLVKFANQTIRDELTEHVDTLKKTMKDESNVKGEEPPTEN